MKKVMFKETNIIHFFKSKGFYVALATCLIAVGAATWVAIENLSAGDYIDTTSTYQYGAAVTSTSSTSSYNDMTASTSSEKKSTTSSNSTKNSTSSNNISVSSAEAKQANTTATYFVLPLTGDIIKNYSNTELQYSETYRDWRLHTSVDIQGDLGARINSSGEGTVTDVYTDPLWGKVVKIDHGNVVIGTYCGLDNVKVNKGDVVDVNQQIGTLGEIPCECVEAVHLHLSFTKGGSPVSPLILMGITVDNQSE